MAEMVVGPRRLRMQRAQLLQHRRRQLQWWKKGGIAHRSIIGTS
jgi:hypothetical protein